MSDTPYRVAGEETEGPKPRPRHAPEVETENPPHARAAGAMLLFNTLVGMALILEQQHQGIESGVGVLGVAVIVDIPLACGLLVHRPRKVLPAGIRRLTAFRLVCGLAISIMAVWSNPASGLLGAFSMVAPMALLARAVTPTRMAIAAGAQLVTLACVLWTGAWMWTGERIGLGYLMHARGLLGAEAAGTQRGGGRPYTLTVPSGWWLASADGDGAATDLDLVQPGWDARVSVRVTDVPWDSAPLAEAEVRAEMIRTLEHSGLDASALTRIEVDDGMAFRICEGRSATAACGYTFRRHARGVMVILQAELSRRASRALRAELLEMFRSLRVEAPPVEALTHGDQAPLAGGATGTLTGQMVPWQVDVPRGWWRLTEAEARRRFGDDWREPIITAPFENVVLAIAQVAPTLDGNALREEAMNTRNVSHTTFVDRGELGDVTEVDAFNAEGQRLLRLFYVRRDDRAMLFEAFTRGPSEARMRDVLDIIRSARMADVRFEPTAPPTQ